MELSLEEDAGSQQVKLANLGCQDTLTSLFGVWVPRDPVREILTLTSSGAFSTYLGQS